MLGFFARTEKPVGSVLWLDNDIGDFEPAVNKLKKRGIEVHAAQTVDEAYKVLQSNNINLGIIDLKLNSDQEGIEFIKLAYTAYPKLGFLVYSNYAHLSGPSKRLMELSKQLGARLKNLPKALTPSVNTPEFDSVFTDTIEALVRKKKPVEGTVASFDMQPIEKLTPEVTLAEYLTFPIGQRVKLLEEFRIRHAEVIERLFSEGYLWLLFLGENDKPVKMEKDPALILDDKEIRKLAAQAKKIPYHFFSETIADDFDPSSTCSRTSGANGYPALRLEFNDHTFETHFDSGLYQTHFDYDFCELIGLIQAIDYPGLGSSEARTPPGRPRTKKPYATSKFNVAGSIVKKTSQESFDIVLSGLATLDWERTRFFRECFSDCTLFQTPRSLQEPAIGRTKAGMCAFRNGLLGRTLLEDNPKLTILLRHCAADILVEDVAEATAKNTTEVAAEDVAEVTIEGAAHITLKDAD